jgi:hypothetical protein
MASTFGTVKGRIFVVHIIYSYQAGLVFKFDSETGSPKCVFRDFSQTLQPSTSN